MAGREAIQAIVSDLPHSPERTEIVSDTGADMQVQLMTHRDGKAAIDEAYNAALRELSDFTASQPTLDEMIASAQAELDSGQ